MAVVAVVEAIWGGAQQVTVRRGTPASAAEPRCHGGPCRCESVESTRSPLESGTCSRDVLAVRVPNA